jgi:hypothetical protein
VFSKETSRPLGLFPAGLTFTDLSQGSRRVFCKLLSTALSYSLKLLVYEALSY